MRAAIILGLLFCLSSPAAAGGDDFSSDSFGTVRIYRQGQGDPGMVVLFLSGAEGWGDADAAASRLLAGSGTMVVGIDTAVYLQRAAAADTPCIYVGGDLEALSRQLQKELHLNQYRTPVLAGRAAGAALVYAALAQGPTGPFLGGIGIGFRPVLVPSKSFCQGRDLTFDNKGKGGVMFHPSARIEIPWIVFEGEKSPAAVRSRIRDFLKPIAKGAAIEVPEAGEDFSVPSQGLPQLREALSRMTSAETFSTSAADRGVADLPLEEVPATGEDKGLAAVLLTGDGGWAEFDRSLAAALARRGVPVIGFNSLNYFWSRRTPEKATLDLERVIVHSLVRWQKKKVVLIGYSFGADVLPFMVRRLDPAIRSQVVKVALLGLSDSADFEFHLSDWTGGERDDSLPVRPEVEALQDRPILCVYGREEEDSLCPQLATPNLTRFETGGGHHFGGEVESVATAILSP
jgi:type IV secretory pathway VirJ component